MSDDRILSLLVDKQGDLWIGTPVGLSRLRQADRVQNIAHLEHFIAHKNSGLTVNTAIQVIYEDSQQHLWLGTKNQGLIHLEPRN